VTPDSLTTQHVPEKTHGEIMSVLIALMIAMLLAALDQSIVATALPRIASDLNGLTKLSWVVTAYLITSAIAMPIYGKLGDMLGRKKIFQIAIIIFLAGSALCGLSQNMEQLIFFRALQGIGAGGMMSLNMAIIGDIIPPRQRGRYQGYFGAVWGIASIAGPVLGGIFTDDLTWRWIFYINLPLGILALSLIASRLHLVAHKIEHRIDYLGSALLSVAIVSLILTTVWGGLTYAWTSWQILSLIATTLVFSVLFVIRELKATEPVIPLSLFKNEIVSVSTVLGFLTGLAMFASLIYIPLYQQIVRGYSPTKSGLLMLPIVVGLFISSITSGRLITKYGHYRIFPIIGTSLMTIGMWLFSHVSLTTSYFTLSLWMFVIGLGLGLLMQVPIVAVQNSVEHRQLGTATSTVSFFRTIGSALGGSIFGAILISRITGYLGSTLPRSISTKVVSGLSSGVEQISHIPVLIRHDLLSAYVHSFHDMFLIGIPFGIAAFISALLLREKPLREYTRERAAGQALEFGEEKSKLNA
jgi:EmrB/QacA subfamily drug resistance transporter